MKLIKKMAFLSLTLVILSACSNAEKDNKETGAVKSSPKGITVNKIAFQEVKAEELPQNMKFSIINLKPNKGFIVYEDKEYYYVSIFAGKKNTGGYSIKVLQVEDNEGKTNILVEETSPVKGDIVTQVLTYPYTTIKIKGVTPNISVENKKGEKYERLLKEGEVY